MSTVFPSLPTNEHLSLYPVITEHLRIIARTALPAAFAIAGTGFLPEPEPLGQPVAAVILQGVAFGEGAGGAPEVYFAVNGEPATFYAVNAETREVTFSRELPGFDVVWAITAAADGNIYFAGTRDGDVYRYSPTDREIENLGSNGTGYPWTWDLVAANDGKVYGSTSRGAGVFEIDTESGTSRAFATEFTPEDYARGIGTSEDALYIGVGMTAHLFRADRETGEIREIEVPNSGRSGSSISRAWAYGDRLLVRSGGSRLFVLDRKDYGWIRGEENRIEFDYDLSPPSPYDPNRIYYKRGDRLYRYDLAADTVEPVDADTPLPTNPMRGFGWFVPENGAAAGRPVLGGLTEFGEFLVYDPVKESLEIDAPRVEPQGVPIQSAEFGPDGLLYLGGYQGGLAVWDPETAEVVRRLPQLPQSEGIGFFEGEVFFGTYGSARIYRYAPDKPVDFGHTPDNNPGLVFQLGHRQDRPFALEPGGGKLFIGSVPGYGVVGGALTVYDGESGEWRVFPEPIPEQSIIGLAWGEDGLLYGSTSVFGGLGSRPSAERAKVFAWDPEMESLIRSVAPEIPDIDAVPLAIGDLSFGPDGRLWAAAQGTLFVMDPETFEVVRSKTVFPSDWDLTHYWRPVYLRWGDDGLLYTSLDRRMVVFEPERWEVLHRGGPATTLVRDPEGDLYFSRQATLFRLSGNTKSP